MSRHMKTILVKFACFLAVCGVYSQIGSAALPNGTTWEVRHAGSDANGGGFVTGAGGTDYSQQSAAQFSGTMLASAGGSTNPCVVTSGTHNFVSTDVGNIMQISAGTNWITGFYEIVSTGTNAATLDRACGTAASISGGSWAEGGALADLTELNTAMSTTSSIMQTGWVKADATYQTSAGYVINFTSTGEVTPQINGYTTTRGDGGRATLQATAINLTVLSIQNNNNLQGLTVRNFTIDCNSEGATIGAQVQAYGNALENVLVENYNAARAFDFDTGGFQGEVCRLCTATGGTIHGDRVCVWEFVGECVSVLPGDSGGGDWVSNGWGSV